MLKEDLDAQQKGGGSMSNTGSNPQGAPKFRAPRACESKLDWTQCPS
jgi:hypothetical protein